MTLGADVILHDRTPATSPGRASADARPRTAGRCAPLLEREGLHYRAEWEARWSEAEDLYFERLMPPSAFDLVLDGSRDLTGDGQGAVPASTSANVRANVCASPGQRADT